MKKAVFAASFTAAALLAACGGGGSSSGGASVAPPAVTATPTAVPTATPTVSSQQIITAALPSTAIGAVVDPTYGLIGGYTQTGYSQTLGFAPGSQVMIRNGQAGVPHTLNVISTTSFPVSPTISMTANGTTLDANFASGMIAGGGLIGPFTLASGTYYVGCAFHYSSANMRTVIKVAANAAPGPAATQAPGATTTPPPGGGGYY